MHSSCGSSSKVRRNYHSPNGHTTRQNPFKKSPSLPCASGAERRAQTRSRPPACLNIYNCSCRKRHGVLRPSGIRSHDRQRKRLGAAQHFHRVLLKAEIVTRQGLGGPPACPATRSAKTPCMPRGSNYPSRRRAWRQKASSPLAKNVSVSQNAVMYPPPSRHNAFRVYI